MSSSTITCNLWSDAFVYADRTPSVYANIIGQLNTNLLMCNCKWLKAHSSCQSLHAGPFIPCKEPCGPVCNISCLKCASCIAAKATICKPGICSGDLQPPSQKVCDKFVKWLEGCQEKILKVGHTKLGDCISADHYISAVLGCLPNSHGNDNHGYMWYSFCWSCKWKALQLPPNLYYCFWNYHKQTPAWGPH